MWLSVWSWCRSGVGGLCAVSPAGVQRGGVSSTPDDHFAAGPDCRVRATARGRVGGAGGCPTVRTGIEFAAAVEIHSGFHPPQTIISLPVHTAECWNRPSGTLVMLVAVQAVRARIVTAASIQKILVIPSAPDDHLAAGPDCRMIGSAGGRVGNARCGPTIGARIVSPAGRSTENRRQIRPRRSFRYRSRSPYDDFGLGRVGEVGRNPTIQGWIVSPARVQISENLPRRSSHSRSRLR